MTDRTLKSKVSKLQELQAEINGLTTQAEALKDQIKAELEVRAVDEYKAGNSLVRWKPVVSSRFDSKAFKQAHSGLYSKYTTQTETRRFTLVPA